MGSIAPHLHREGFALMSELERLTKDGADVEALASALDAALADMSRRDKVVLYLAAYLSRTLTGTLPDPTQFLL